MLDYKYYPYIFDNIISYLDPKGLQAMRPTSRAVNNTVYSIYRHVLVQPDAPLSDRMFVRDPQDHRLLLVLDKKIPHSRRLRGSDNQHKPSFREAMDRLTEHTRIFDFACPMQRPTTAQRSRLVLKPLIESARVSRQLCLVPASVVQSSPRHHCSIVATFGGWVPETGPVYDATTVYTLGIPVPSQDVLIVIEAGRRESTSSGEDHLTEEVLDGLCQHLERKLYDIYFLGPQWRSVTFIEIEKPDLQPLNIDWERTITRLQSWWSTHGHTHTFSHKSSTDFQHEYGLNDVQFGMLTTVPNWKELAQPGR
ncbi:uncharacterized protein LOC62_07G008951 [Vanrija pseudolonga]|uniref:Uncharacterized protein n=1 Tax=Vanrija pseudolonga TaxID=143232 RepID=A0AAF1BLT7_9TREE|nr:hypothetical protein LOC62_07G008951 [Vanrija pseudolonga]